MPFPALIVWGAAAAVAAVGVKKGIDAHKNNSKAKDIGAEAEEKYNKAQKSLEKSRNSTGKALATLGKLKVEVFSNQIKHLVDMHKKFKSKLSGFDEKIVLDNIEDCDFAVTESIKLEESIKAGISGAITGGLTALGAYGTVGTFAAASTGTAISSLSGAAATNATLAWLGGGSLAAGGFGMAGGMIALGGITLAPLLAIGGFYAASKSEKNLTNAEEYSAKVDVACEEIKKVKTTLKGIRSNCAEVSNVILKLVEYFEEYKVDSMEDIEKFKKMMLIGKNLKEILNQPIMTNKGDAVSNIESVCSGYLELN